MTTINILPEKLINQIAAGEVVENPSSVVKELIENAVDAKATKIEVHISSGGMNLIKVSDDGIGMTKEDLKRSILRHATSKIKSFDDLLNISSMGFRGEALASIASISKLSVISKREKSHLLKAEGGEIKSLEAYPHLKGTSIEVRHLFYNVPARKKFQKSISILTSEVIKTVCNLALTYVDISFVLIVDGKRKIDVKASDSKSFSEKIKKRAIDILGEKFFINLKSVSFEEGPIKIEGFIGEPYFTKKNRLSQYFILNRRFAQNNILSESIKQAYGTKIDERSFPIFLLYIDIKPDFLDVNIHPQKKYVKISEESFIKQSIKRCVEETFLEEINMDIDTLEKDQNDLYINDLEKDRKEENYIYKDEKKKDFVSIGQLSEEGKSMEREKEIFLEEKKDLFSYQKSVLDNFSQNEIFQGLNEYEKKGKEEKNIFPVNICEEKDFQSHFIFKQFYFLSSYEKADQLMVIDLKAASFAIFYENFLLNNFEKDSFNFSMQTLLLEREVNFKKEDMFLIEENLSFFKKIGFEFNILTDMTISIYAMANFYDEEDIEDIFHLAIKELKSFGSSNIDIAFFIKKIIKKICINTKSKRSFSLKEAEAIYKNLRKLKDPNVDPLGRKNIIFLDEQMIKKMF